MRRPRTHKHVFFLIYTVTVCCMQVSKQGRLSVRSSLVVFGLTVTTPSLTPFLFLTIIPPAFLDTLLGILTQWAEENRLRDFIICAGCNHSQSIQLLQHRHVQSSLGNSAVLNMNERCWLASATHRRPGKTLAVLGRLS